MCIWQGPELLQCIHHPNSVWTAVGLPDTEGDFITCGHDGVIRLFSRRTGFSSEVEGVIQSLNTQFNQEVYDAKQRKRSGPSSEEIAKATPWDSRGRVPGKSEGQVMVFNKDNRLIAAQWSADTRAWVEIGEVTGSGDSGEINSVHYDHVLPVEIDCPGGAPLSLQLGYNNLESPYDAAQRFIELNSLPQYHLRQVGHRHVVVLTILTVIFTFICYYVCIDR